MAPKAPACLGARLQAICVVLLELAINIYRDWWEDNILQTTVNTFAISQLCCPASDLFVTEIKIYLILDDWFDDDWQFVNKCGVAFLVLIKWFTFLAPVLMRGN